MENKPIKPNPFHFTEEEEKLIRGACIIAKKYMRTFGKGRKPYMVDLRRYYQNESNESPVEREIIRTKRTKQNQ